MRILDCPQGSDEWLLARAGRVTASCVDKIITPKTRKASSSQDGYMAKLLAEWVLGVSLDDVSTPFMERGSELEIEGVRRYEFENDVDTCVVGFIVRDDDMVGASPDRLVGDNGVLEVKCPAVQTHVGYMLTPTKLVDDYWCQIQAELWISEREWVDLISHHPTLPQVVRRVERDAEFIGQMEGHVNAFVLNMAAHRATLLPYKQAPRPRRDVTRDSDPFATAPATPIILHGEPFQ